MKKLVAKRKKAVKAGEEDLEEQSDDEALVKPNTPTRRDKGGTGVAVAMTSQMMEAEIGTQRDFFKGMTAGRCPHCGAHSPVLKREGYTKLFLMPLPPKKRAANAAQGTVRREEERFGDADRRTECHVMWRRQHVFMRADFCVALYASDDQGFPGGA